ncbi:MAG TPA: 50S ribosomal protein L32, partial [Firmicutes bacterium]|nr:50S ribosomal protein L32 [Bacillota bacterium]
MPAVPKQKSGKSRTRKRRANWKAEAPTLSVCPQCK